MNSEYKTPNNIHHNFPGLMEDKRLFTDYTQNSVIEQKKQQELNFKTNSEYRQYLIDNASSIIQENKFTYLNDVNQYISNNDPDHLFNLKSQRFNNPYLFDSIQDCVQPYGYENNFTKSKYLSRERLADKTVNKYKH
jgi:hypothetical protein